MRCGFIHILINRNGTRRRVVVLFTYKLTEKGTRSCVVVLFTYELADSVTAIVHHNKCIAYVQTILAISIV